MKLRARVVVGPLVPLAAAAALAIPLACASKVTPAPEAKSDTGTDTAPTTIATGTPEKCAACVEARCKATWDACAADAMCIAQTECIAACTDADCEARCKSSRPSALGDATQACFRGPCAADCTR
jgi:hypothetical protein